ncbi:MAG: Trifunctional nucleotide phosphoesterase protein YfkN precursor, partial [Planctomycetota bacterium]
PSSSYTITFDAGVVANGTNVGGVIKRAGGAAAATNGNSLGDGNYVLRIDPTKVQAEGFSLVGDAVFGDLATDRFFRMYGDNDGDGDVDGTDAVALRNAQLSYNAALDWDGNGSVSAGADITNFNSNRNRRRRLF